MIFRTNSVEHGIEYSLAPVSAADCPRLQLSTAHALDPLDVAPDGGHIIAAVLSDEHDILNTNAADSLVPCEDRMIDMVRIPYCGEQMRRKVDTGLDRLKYRIVSGTLSRA